MLYVDQYVYTNKILNTHPLEKFGFALLTMLICLLAERPAVHLATIVIMLGILVYIAGIPCSVVLKLLSLPLGFLLVGVITLALTVSGDPAEMLAIVKLGPYGVGVTERSLELAMSTLLRALSSVSSLYFLALTTPMTDLIYVLGVLRIPRIVTELMAVIYRFIFIFLETAFYIYTAQSSRWGYSSFRRSLYSFGLLFGNIWSKAFIRAQAMFTSLLSRGYEEEIRVLHPPYRFSSYSIAAYAGLDAFLLLLTIV
ncbi:MAG: Cobalt transport protein CbiQ [Dehalococcoidia bacterium]|nr:Cobalt transport protein CbiQ [Bacillota bacterium]MBT9141641.1 Cobalt transport protein CbiQ [Bacillota bacterium]